MKLFLCVQGILVFIQSASTHTVSSFYQHYPGVVWDNCMEPMSAKRLQCVTMCGASTGCLGINFLDDVNATRPCQLCLSSDTKSVSQVPPTSLQSMYFRFNKRVYPSATIPYHVIHFPSGLVEGQIFFFNSNLADYEEMGIVFLENIPWTNVPPLPHVDVYIHIAFNTSVRPNNILMSNFDQSLQKWVNPTINRHIYDFLIPGKNAYIIFFVHQLTYTVYVDGKLFYDYPRPNRKNLEDIKRIRLEGYCKHVMVIQ